MVLFRLSQKQLTRLILTLHKQNCALESMGKLAEFAKVSSFINSILSNWLLGFAYYMMSQKI